MTGNRCERKYSLHSNEVSLFTMRLGRGREWAVKMRHSQKQSEIFGGCSGCNPEYGNKDVLIPAARCYRQLTGEVGCRCLVAGKGTDERGAI